MPGGGLPPSHLVCQCFGVLTMILLTSSSTYYWTIQFGSNFLICLLYVSYHVFYSLENVLTVLEYIWQLNSDLMYVWKNVLDISHDLDHLKMT